MTAATTGPVHKKFCFKPTVPVEADRDMYEALVQYEVYRARAIICAIPRTVWFYQETQRGRPQVVCPSEGYKSGNRALLNPVIGYVNDGPGRCIRADPIPYLVHGVQGYIPPHTDIPPDLFRLSCSDALELHSLSVFRKNFHLRGCDARVNRRKIITELQRVLQTRLTTLHSRPDQGGGYILSDKVNRVTRMIRPEIGECGASGKIGSHVTRYAGTRATHTIISTTDTV
jgi:hypothetical protein